MYLWELAVLLEHPTCPFALWRALIQVPLPGVFMYLSVKLCLERLGEELSVVLLSHGAFWSQNNSYTVQLLQWRYSELVQVVCSLHCSERQMLHAKILVYELARSKLPVQACMHASCLGTWGLHRGGQQLQCLEASSCLVSSSVPNIPGCCWRWLKSNRAN